MCVCVVDVCIFCCVVIVYFVVGSGFFDGAYVFTGAVVDVAVVVVAVVDAVAAAASAAAVCGTCIVVVFVDRCIV